jgi:hypothetical protein
LDTVLVRYRLENRDTQPHTVGLRFLLDTHIGTNDGPTFYIAPVWKDGEQVAEPRWQDGMEVFTAALMPDYVMALEKPYPYDSASINAVLAVRLARCFEPLEKLVLCRWPRKTPTAWDWPYQPPDEPEEELPDSCAVLYWAETAMPPGARRNLAFSYGLGRSGGWEPEALEP